VWGVRCAGPLAEHLPRRVVPTRAAENHVFVAYANFPHEQNLHNNPHYLPFCGASAVVGPDGADLARGPTNAAQLLVATVDFTPHHELLVRNPYWHDRRPELYQELLRASRA